MEGSTDTNPRLSAALSPSITEDRGVAAVLREITSWRAEADAQHQLQLDEVDEEVARLKTAIEDLQRQLTALGDFRNDLVVKASRLPMEQSARAHEGIFERLHGQADDLEPRARVALLAEARRQKAFQERVQAADMGRVLEEYRQFKAAAEQLAALPASYREALTAHHKAHEAALIAFAAEHDPGPASLDERPLELDVVFTVDAAEGEPELISVVLPVREEVYTRWEDHDDDLQLTFAARVVQGLYRAAHQLGLHKAHAMYGGHRGLLAVELELGRGHTKDVAPRIAQVLNETLAQAPELLAAKVVARATVVPTDYLLPPDGPAEVNDDA